MQHTWFVASEDLELDRDLIPTQRMGKRDLKRELEEWYKCNRMIDSGLIHEKQTPKAVTIRACLEIFYWGIWELEIEIL